MEKFLLSRAKDGDGNAFIKLLTKYEMKLYFVAKSKLENEEDVKDAIQETLYQSYRNFSQLRKEDSFGSWITKILINNCNHILRDKNYYNISYDDMPHGEFTDNGDCYVELDDDIDYFGMISFLKSEDKLILSMSYQGYTFKEISKILEMNENTVRTRFKRIKDKIVKKYGKES